VTTYPQPWLDAAAEAAHKALSDAEGGWHYPCLTGDGSCSAGHHERAMLTEDVMPEVLKALAKVGALKETL
jgi:hypothetical protein